jgi:hypothetical protein
MSVSVDTMRAQWAVGQVLVKLPVNSGWPKPLTMDRFEESGQT